MSQPDPASLDALIAQWQAEAHERRETAREAEAKGLLLTAVSLYKETEQLQECAHELAALLPTRDLQNGCIGCGARTVVAYTIERKPGPFCHECWSLLKLHVSQVNLLNAAVDRRELDVELPVSPPLIPADTRTIQRRLRDALVDLVDAYREGTSAAWRLCGLCDMEHRPDDAMPGDQTHRKGCVVDAAEAALRAYTTQAASLGVVPPPPHVHTKSCYDDPGAAHGKPFLVCDQEQEHVVPPPPAAWQPIETAPHEGEVLVHDDGAVLLAYWHEGFWLDSAGAAGNQRIDPPPQHWMPKPEPPEGK